MPLRDEYAHGKAEQQRDGDVGCDDKLCFYVDALDETVCEQRAPHAEVE